MENETKIMAMSTEELIMWCRQRKKLLGYSNQKLSEIADVPQGTVDRIMAGKYTEFKYSSIRPIIVALIGFEEETPEPKPGDSKQAHFYYDTIEGYKLIVDSKNMEIMELRKANEALEHKLQDLMDKLSQQ